MKTPSSQSSGARLLKATGTLCFIAVIVIQQFLRPQAGPDTAAWLSTVYGNGPNFFAAALCVLPFLRWAPGRTRVKMLQVNLLCNALVFAVLWIWEYAQLIAHRPVDHNDILASLLGCLCFFGLIAVLIRRGAFEQS